MSKRDDMEFRIAEQLTAVFRATCDACNVEDTMEALDAGEAACGFYDDGWRVNAANVLLCRRCARKHRKR